MNAKGERFVNELDTRDVVSLHHPENARKDGGSARCPDGSGLA